MPLSSFKEEFENRYHVIPIVSKSVQGHIRRKDVLMSRVGVYISVIIVLCHSIRLVPNTWELLQRQTVDRGVNEVSSFVSTVNSLLSFPCRSCIFYPILPDIHSYQWK